MKLGIRSKLVITLLLANGLLAGLMLWLSTESFNRGFIDYINQVEVQKLDPLVTDMIAFHERFGNWSWVNRDQRRLWRSLIRKHLLGPQLADLRESLRRQASANATGEALLFDPRLLLRDDNGGCDNQCQVAILLKGE